jgi:rhombotail lipoprotein
MRAIRPAVLLIVPLLGALPVLLSGCSQLWGTGNVRTGASSSLVDYLYPEGEIPPDFDVRVPQLKLPLRVGIAFVPGSNAGKPTYGQPVLSEAEKTTLLELVRERFKDRKYISSIEIIPETYLRSSRGFDGVAQAARLYGVDVMGLVSYDQVAAVADNKLSLTYWTIVGAYIIKGTENEVQTFVDTAVFDIGSRKLLFRAPGVDRREKSSTAVDSAGKLQEVRSGSFVAAMSQMRDNLSVELDRFEQRLKDEPKLADVSWRDGKSGGAGALDGWSLGALLVSFAAWRRRRAIPARAVVAPR